MRGDLIDIGGRRLRVVTAGPAAAQPLIVLLHGSFGCASDWAAVQARLSARGLRSLAWDRAGMGYSDPGPAPRDAHAVTADLAALLERLGETGPLVLVGHSMAGLFVRRYTLSHPQRVVGVVLADAVSPRIEAVGVNGARAIRAYGRSLRLVQALASWGLMKWIGDRIGLPREASLDKRRISGLATHAKASADEVDCWPASAAQATEGVWSAELPLAAVVAGLGAMAPRPPQEAAAHASHGAFEVVPRANHADLLGMRHAEAIARGVDHVLAARRG